MLAARLVSYARHPLAVLDPDDRIVAINDALEQLLGLRTGQAERADFVALCVAPEEATPLRKSLARARKEASGRAQFLVTTPKGERLRLTAELSAAGREGREGLILAVLAYRAQDSRPPWLGLAEEAYDLSMRPGDRWTIVAATLRGAHEGRAEALIGRPCYVALHGADAPCQGCPVQALERSAEVDYEMAVLGGAGASNEISLVAAERLSDETVRVYYQPVRERDLSVLTRSRLQQLATRARLSDREQEVLELLALGRSTEQIGQTLGVAPRTVKFHQVNLLQKLGADSRADLLRLVL
ncbi:MAG: hypothetical protein IT371_05585 [Deltaproteobacteria bacterium]|nr:hypothetical protein [Deltaproteobacteria bacterium]